MTSMPFAPNATAKTETVSPNDAVSPKMKRNLAWALGLSAVVVGWALFRRAKNAAAPVPGGMRVGPCAPNLINLDARYGARKDRDIVDQASWESFPASDPPAY